MAAATPYKPEIKDAAAGPFNQAAQDSLDTQKVSAHLETRVKAMPVPQDSAGNSAEWQRRMGEIARENLANKYLVARQDGKTFGTGDAIRTIDALPADYSPVKQETYAMEHGNLPQGNLKPQTLETQRTLDSAADALSRAEFMNKNGEYFAETGAKKTMISTDGISSALALNKIPAKDAVSYYELSTGNTLSESLKNGLLDKEKNLATPAASVKTATPTSP